MTTSKPEAWLRAGQARPLTPPTVNRGTRPISKFELFYFTNTLYYYRDPKLTLI